MTSLLRHPKPLWILAFGRFCDTFSYYGTQTILVLYLIHTFNLSRSDSVLLYGAYTAFLYCTPILGGIIADKWLGGRNGLLSGGILHIAGNLLLMLTNRYWFCLGIVTSLIGSGLYKSTSAHLIGSLYPSGDSRKEGGFTWVYLAQNVGGTLAPFVYGLVVYSVGWNIGFLCSAVLVAFDLIWFLSNWSVWPINAKAVFSKLIYPAIVLLCFLFSIPFFFLPILNSVLIVLFILAFVYLITRVFRYHGAERKRLSALLIMGFFALFYFAVGLQIGSTVTLFIQNKIHQGVIQTELPASVFSALYCFLVVALAPIVTFIWSQLKKRGIIFSLVSKIMVGIFLGAIGILWFAFGGITNLVYTSIILGNLFLSAGELVLTPASFAAISDTAPDDMKSTMIGGWYFFVALGGYCSSLFANVSHHLANYLPFQHLPYVGDFIVISIFTLLMALGLFLLSPTLNRMMR